MSVVLIACAVGGTALLAFPPQPGGRLRGLTGGTRRRRDRAAGWRRVLPVVAGLVLGVPVVASGRSGAAAAVLMGAATGLWLWRRRVRRRSRARREAVTADFLGLLSGHLDSGAPPGAAVAGAAGALRGRDEEHVRRLAVALTAPDRAGAGVPAAGVGRSGHGPAAGPAGGGDDDATTAQLARLWAVAHRRGLPTAALVAQARDRLERSLHHRESAAASLTGPRSTATVLSLLPLAGIALGSAMGADPLAVLTGPGPGGVLLPVGVGLICAGLAWSQAIIDSAAGQ